MCINKMQSLDHSDYRRKKRKTHEIQLPESGTKPVDLITEALQHERQHEIDSKIQASEEFLIRRTQKEIERIKTKLQEIEKSRNEPPIVETLQNEVEIKKKIQSNVSQIRQLNKKKARELREDKYRQMSQGKSVASITPH